MAVTFVCKSPAPTFVTQRPERLHPRQRARLDVYPLCAGRGNVRGFCAVRAYWLPQNPDRPRLCADRKVTFCVLDYGSSNFLRSATNTVLIDAAPVIREMAEAYPPLTIRESFRLQYLRRRLEVARPRQRARRARHCTRLHFRGGQQVQGRRQPANAGHAVYIGFGEFFETNGGCSAGCSGSKGHIIAPRPRPAANTLVG
ncbi:hypothetical protein CATRI_02170 [Corynebacterium atrinae]|nr:hypothetical protein CATRI_02170 [Corynebacterium atrinae]